MIRYRWFVVLPLIVFVVTPAWTQSPSEPTLQEPLPVDAVLSARTFPRTSPSLSPDGKWIAYSLIEPAKVLQPIAGAEYFTETGTPTWAIGCDVWVTDLETGKSTNLTGSKGANWGPVWSPNGRYLAFYSDRSGKSNLWVYDAMALSLRSVSDVVVRTLDTDELVRWTRDGDKLLTTVVEEGLADNGVRKSEVQRGQPESQAQANIVVYRFPDSSASTRVERSSIQGDSETLAYRADLALVDLATGRVERIARGVNPVWYEISADNKFIAFASRQGLVDQDSGRILFDLTIVDRSTGRKVVAATIQQSSYLFSATWSPDGKWLSYVTMEGWHLEKAECYLVSVETGTVRKLAETSHAVFSVVGMRAPLWSPDSQQLYLLSWDSNLVKNTALWRISVIDGQVLKLGAIPDHELGIIVASQVTSTPLLTNSGRSVIVTALDTNTKRSGFYAIDVSTGGFVKLLEEDKQYGPDQSVSTFSSADGQHIIYMAQDAGHPPNLWLVSSRFDTPKRITNVNPEFDRYRMGRSRVIEWLSPDGERRRGALLLPEDYQEGRQYPMIVWVYGTLYGSDYLNYFGLWPWDPLHNMQLYATRGYAVLLPDSLTAIGTPMASVAKSILPGVNKAIELGIADPQKLGLMGESFGGYTTLSLIVQTTRFKAAVSLAGMGDLVGLYGEMDHTGDSSAVGLLESGQIKMGGTPWEFRDRYIENSPVFYLDRVQTPLLIIHGSEDTAVAPFLADQIFVGLRRQHKEVLYAKYKGEGHGIEKYGNRVDCAERIIEWFDKHLKGISKTED
jgi:dipeptidyl aminopeptidase/acylaminoacyl peptidase